MLILSIETSTKVCSVALHKSGELMACYELLAEKSHSGLLTTLVSEVVRHTGHTLHDIGAIAVAKGPGSYTGLRIGVSTAKGLCFALNKPLIAVNTLEAMAHQLKDFVAESHLLCPMIDARRMEVYCSVFQAKTLALKQPTEALVLNENSFQDFLETQPVVFFGDGSAKCKPLLVHHSNAIFLEAPIYPSAKSVGYIASKSNTYEDIPTFEPFYLKDFMMTTQK